MVPISLLGITTIWNCHHHPRSVAISVSLRVAIFPTASAAGHQFRIPRHRPARRHEQSAMPQASLKRRFRGNPVVLRAVMVMPKQRKPHRFAVQIPGRRWLHKCRRSLILFETEPFLRDLSSTPTSARIASLWYRRWRSCHPRA